MPQASVADTRTDRSEIAGDGTRARTDEPDASDAPERRPNAALDTGGGSSSATIPAARNDDAASCREADANAGGQDATDEGAGDATIAERPPPHEGVTGFPSPRIVITAAVDTGHLETIARGIGRELADLSSGVQGHAQLLCEAMGEPQLVVTRAEQLWTAVRRLRLFSEKILSFAYTPPVHLAPTDVRACLASVRQEMEDHSGSGLHVSLTTGMALPLAIADETALRNALLFLVESLLGREPTAGEVCLRAHTSLDDDESTVVEIEIQVEAEESTITPPRSVAQIRLNEVAARNLLEGQGARVHIEHEENLNATACITLHATCANERDAEGHTRALEPRGMREPQSTAGPPEGGSAPAIAAAPPRRRHHYGGILILESDPVLRNLLAHELEKTGRNILTAADGAAARSLFMATPDRFELLILEGHARREGGHQLAGEALALNDHLRVLMVTSDPGGGVPELPPSSAARCSLIRKPFGIMEIREAGARLLDL